MQYLCSQTGKHWDMTVLNLDPDKPDDLNDEDLISEDPLDDEGFAEDIDPTVSTLSLCEDTDSLQETQRDTSDTMGTITIIINL